MKTRKANLLVAAALALSLLLLVAAPALGQTWPTQEAPWTKEHRVYSLITGSSFAAGVTDTIPGSITNYHYLVNKWLIVTDQDIYFKLFFDNGDTTSWLLEANEVHFWPPGDACTKVDSLRLWKSSTNATVRRIYMSHGDQQW